MDIHKIVLTIFFNQIVDPTEEQIWIDLKYEDTP